MPQAGSYWGTSRLRHGHFAATYPRGLTSNRHAGRPDRWSIRAFAFGQARPLDGIVFGDRGKQQFHPRSPVQGDRSPAPYFIIAVVAALAIWTAQQQWTQDSNPPVARETGHEGPRSASGDVRTVFSADDYPIEAQRKGEEGTVQARLDVDARGRVSRCTVIRSSGSVSLDSATCRILERRARFTPARDVNGKAVVDSYVTPPIRWQLEG